MFILMATQGIIGTGLNMFDSSTNSVSADAAAIQANPNMPAEVKQRVLADLELKRQNAELGTKITKVGLKLSENANSLIGG